jgi:acyl-coenzyme A thioesterase PaaI-like protein
LKIEGRRLNGLPNSTTLSARLAASGAAAENNLSSDVEVYKGYQIEYQAREAAGIVRVIANVTAQPLPVGRRPQRFAAEARDPVDARLSARGQATYWIDNVAPA